MAVARRRGGSVSEWGALRPSPAAPGPSVMGAWQRSIPPSRDLNSVTSRSSTARKSGGDADRRHHQREDAGQSSLFAMETHRRGGCVDSPHQSPHRRRSPGGPSRRHGHCKAHVPSMGKQPQQQRNVHEQTHGFTSSPSRTRNRLTSQPLQSPRPFDGKTTTGAERPRANTWCFVFPLHAPGVATWAVGRGVQDPAARRGTGGPPLDERDWSGAALQRHA